MGTADFDLSACQKIEQATVHSRDRCLSAEWQSGFVFGIFLQRADQQRRAASVNQSAGASALRYGDRRADSPSAGCSTVRTRVVVVFSVDGAESCVSIDGHAGSVRSASPEIRNCHGD